MRALITGVTGQDGSYLAELLISKGYEVFGLRRYCSTDNLRNIKHLEGKINLLYGDLIDEFSLLQAIEKSKPDEVYNLAALSFVGVSWSIPDAVREVNYIGVVKLLQALKEKAREAKFYQASTSEMFGGADECPQNENTPLKPVSPYAQAKLEAHRAVQESRKNGMHASCGILFNHESPRRGVQFVTRKITESVARIAMGQKHVLALGNMDAEKDWGFAGDYVEAMHLMLQKSSPDDYVIGSGEKHTVREFVQNAFDVAGMKVEFCGKGTDEKGYVEGKLAVEVNPAFFRPHDTNPFLADNTKAKLELGWSPKTSFKELVEMMVESDIKRYRS